MNCIFSEFVGKFYTRVQEKKNVSTVTNDHTVLEAVFCSFKKRGFGTMIGCDNIQCTVDWVVPYSLFKCKTYYRLATPNGKQNKQNSQGIKIGDDMNEKLFENTFQPKFLLSRNQKQSNDWHMTNSFLVI